MTIAPVIWLNAPNSWPTTRLRRVLVALPLVEVLQLREHDALVRRRAREAEAADARTSCLISGIFASICSTCLHDAHRVVERRALRRLDEDEDVALIFVGHEAGRHARVDPVGRRRAARRTRASTTRADADQAAQHRRPSRRAAVDDAVDDAEEDALRLLDLAEQQRRPAPASASAR